ncbi:MAG TPA: DNA-binding domain-containing protein [Myxococcales bacterium]|nr:DNA-binding domain-containing protein [Myxococcales bacterium]
MSLAETQALFWRALQGEKIDAGDCFAGTRDLPASERVGIYTDMVLARLVEALRADFPETAAAFGDEAFDGLAREFVRSQPSKHSDLGRLGAGFAAFCPPDARGLAELEWARTEVFVEADEQPLTPEQFQERVDPRAFADQHLRIIQALRLVGATAVWRTGFDVLETVLPAAETRALRLAIDGATIGEICSPFEDPQAAFTAIQSWVAESWLTSLS